MSEAEFLSLANITAHKYGMDIKIDFFNRTVDFLGDNEVKTEVACARELSQLFKELT